MNELRSITGNSVEDYKIKIRERIKSTGFDYSKYLKHVVTECDLCLSQREHWSLYAHCDRYCLPVRSMQCKQCGLVFINPVMDSIYYAKFYEEWYRKLVNAFDGREQPEERLNQSMEIQANEAIKFLGDNLPNGFQIKSMLDIGGSTGVFARKVCDTTGATGYVIDPNKQEIQQAAKKGLTVSCNNFEFYATDRKFDLISMLRTVEHVSTIRGSLQKVKKLLNKDGLLLIDIVNHTFMVNMLKDKCMATKLDHIYQLTSNTIRQYFKITGFEVLSHSPEDARYVMYLVKANG